MGKLYLLFIAFVVVSCEKEEVLVPKAAAREVAGKAAVKEVVDSSGILLEKARETEAFLQKQADSIVRQFDSLGVPK